jgi:hypothetical protein
MDRIPDEIDHRIRRGERHDDDDPDVKLAATARWR